MDGTQEYSWVIACGVAVSLLVVSITVCIICWCCKKEADKDSISMKNLTSNYSEPSDAIVPNNNRTSNYNYTNPFDKRGSDAGIIAVKPTNKAGKNKQKKKSEETRKEKKQNYDYFTPYDCRKSKDGILTVKSSVKSHGKSNKSKTTKSVVRSASEETNDNESKFAEKGDIKLGEYIDVGIPNKEGALLNRSDDGKLTKDAVIDISNGYSDVAYKNTNNGNCVQLRLESKRNLPDPYSVVQLD